MAFDSQPKFSPDGKWIAFISDREGSENIWVMHADGSGVKQVSKDPNNEFASPSWSPDGNYILVSKAGFGITTFEIWMYHVDGGSGLQITKAKPTPTTPRKDRDAIGVVASADGKYLYYAKRTGGFEHNAQFPLSTRRTRKTGDEHLLEQTEQLPARAFAGWYATSLCDAIRDGERPALRNLQTGEDHWVRYPITRDDQESRFTRDLFPGYVFLPDGKEIIYNQDGKIRRLNLATGAESVIPFTAQVSQELGPKLDFPQRVEQGPLKVRLIQDPIESPDGKKMAFSAMTHLYTMDIPGGKPKRLTSGNQHEFQPAWSPDGSSIVYVTWSSEGGQLWRWRLRGTPQQLSKSAAVYSNPVWSPDGSRIVALRGNVYDRENQFDGVKRRNADLVWIPAAGGEAGDFARARCRLAALHAR